MIARSALATRDTTATELMDDEHCDLLALRRTYRQFRVVNALVAGWRRGYTELIRPRLSARRSTTLLDVGCGGGDLARRYARWAVADGLRLAITAIDPDERAHAFAVEQPAVPGLIFARTDTASLRAQDAHFDLITSNHLLHHLDPPALAGLLDDSAALATRLVVHNDLRRSAVAYSGYAVVSRPFARHSFVHHDGLTSIRRSYTAAELGRAAPAPWEIRRRSPFRLLLILDLDRVGRG